MKFFCKNESVILKDYLIIHPWKTKSLGRNLLSALVIYYRDPVMLLP